jgi:hypothetical protein
VDEPDLPAAPEPAVLPPWRVPTAPRIFANVVFATVVVVVQQIVVAQVLTARGFSENYDGVAATVAFFGMVAAVLGGWIGFVYSQRSASDRGLFLIGSWGLSTALGLVVLMSVLPSSRGQVLDAVARDFCEVRGTLLASIQAVGSASSTDELFAESATAVDAFESAADRLHDDAQRARSVGATDLAALLDQAANDLTAFAQGVRRLDVDGTQAAARDLAPVVVALRRTSPIAERCG